MLSVPSYLIELAIALCPSAVCWRCMRFTLANAGCDNPDGVPIEAAPLRVQRCSQELHGSRLDLLLTA